MGLGGTQAIKTVPAHFVLRALRQLWPLDVEDIAILRNDSANPDLDPQRMTLHDRTYVPSVGKGPRRRAGSRGRCSPTSQQTRAASSSA